MATEKDQGTGQHKHKSSEEPYPHHEAPTTKGDRGGSGEHRESSSGEHRGSESHTSGSHSSGSHTSGSHTSGEHRSGSEHSRAESRSESGSHSGGSGSSHSSGTRSASGSETDLKSREYRGPDGEEHHHTKTYMEQHKGESESERRGTERSGSEHSSTRKAS
jgi:hypothetical protein